MFCAWFSVGGNNWPEKVDSVGEAVERFRRVHDEMGFATVKNMETIRNRNGKKVRVVVAVVQQSAMDLYDSADGACECVAGENWHDVADRRYVVGVRGGIVRESV